MSDMPKHEYEVGGHLIDAHGQRHKIVQLMEFNIVMQNGPRQHILPFGDCFLLRYEPPEPFEWITPSEYILAGKCRAVKHGASIRKELNRTLTRKYGSPEGGVA